MVTVGMNYNVIEGKQQEFETVFGKVLQIMGQTEGHRETHLYRDVTRNTSYMILSEWHTREAFEAFTSSQQFKNVTDWGKTKILSSRPRHEVYGTTANTAAAAACPVGAH